VPFRGGRIICAGLVLKINILTAILLLEELSMLYLLFFLLCKFFLNDLSLDVCWLILLEIGLKKLNTLLHQTQLLVEVILIYSSSIKLFFTILNGIEII